MPQGARRWRTATTSPIGTARRRLVRSAIEAFGDLHVLVNNAGFVRDRMFANLEEDEWDAVDARAPQGPRGAEPARRRLLA